MLATSVLGVLTLLAILIIGGIMWRFRSLYFNALDAVEVQAAAMQAAGDPILPEDLYEDHRLPPSIADSTAALLKVLAMLDPDQLKLDGASLPFVGDGNPDGLVADGGKMLVEVEALLQKYGGALAEAEAAASTTGLCRFPLKFEDGWGMKVPHLPKLRSVNKLLALQTRIRALRGDTDGAVASLESMFACTATLENQLSQIEWITGIALLNETFREVIALLEFELNEKQLHRLQAKLDGVAPNEGLTRSLIGERATGFATFNSALPPGAVTITHGNLQHQITQAPIDCEMFLSFISPLIDASRFEFPEAHQQAKSVLRDYEAKMRKTSTFKKKLLPQTRDFLPFSFGAFDAQGRVLAYRDITRVAVASEWYRLEFGDYPMQLEDLVPNWGLIAVPVDPFDGRPLRFVPGKNEITIYSIGLNCKDDGGEGDTNPDSLDLVVRLRAAKRAALPEQPARERE